jgi:hypothetical protein
MTTPDGRKSAEARERARKRGTARWTDPDKRRQNGELTPQKMNDPAVRQRIRDIVQRAAGTALEIWALRQACAAARPSVQRLFLNEVLTPLWSVGAGRLRSRPSRRLSAAGHPHGTRQALVYIVRRKPAGLCEGAGGGFTIAAFIDESFLPIGSATDLGYKQIGHAACRSSDGQRTILRRTRRRRSRMQ